MTGIQGQVTAQCISIQQDGGSHSAVTGMTVCVGGEGVTLSATLPGRGPEEGALWLVLWHLPPRVKGKTTWACPLKRHALQFAENMLQGPLPSLDGVFLLALMYPFPVIFEILQR